MKKNIDTKIVLDTLEITRNRFFETGQDIVEKISIYDQTGTVSGKFGDSCFDFIDFSKVMKGGFNSVHLQMFFESLVHIHYFGSVNDLTLQPLDFIFRRKFDFETFSSLAKKQANTTIALEILKLYVHRFLRNLKIKNESCNKILKSNDKILESLKIIKHAMKIKLHHYGDRDFLVSKIPISEEHQFDFELELNPHIFYTNKPEQIISFAHNANPGVYIIANVPYENYAETAFYIVFRQNGYAYIVENSKHSYRDQIYRNKSDGTSGKDAWLDRKYENCYLPVEIIMSFFENESLEKQIQKQEAFEFISLGKITDCSFETILYTYSFIDKCYSFFKDNSFTKEISNTNNIETIFNLLNNKSENIPVIYKSLLPSIESLDISWFPELVNVEDASEIIPYSKSELSTISNDLQISDLPQINSLTSTEHIRRSMIFRKRLSEVNSLQDQWFEDFKTNYLNVENKIHSFIKNKGLDFIASKGFKNLTYSHKIYRTFGSGFAKDECFKYVDATILKGISIDRKKVFYRLIGNVSSYSRAFFYTNNSFNFNSDRICCHCESRYAVNSFSLQFLDYEIFKTFFEITEKEERLIPQQMKKYLNQSSTYYYGNSILDDIDPLSKIKNPWFKAYFNRENELKLLDSPPAYFIYFDLCGHCSNKFGMKKHV